MQLLNSANQPPIAPFEELEAIKLFPEEIGGEVSPHILDLAKRIVDRDPAAFSIRQVFLYPGVEAIKAYREAVPIYNEYKRNKTLAVYAVRQWQAEPEGSELKNFYYQEARKYFAISRDKRHESEAKSRAAQSLTGVDINPGAVIGQRVFMDHGTGLVIGETSVIEDDVTIYHGVTLGAAAPHKNQKGEKRHPTIGARSILGFDVAIMGPITIGADAKINIKVTIEGANIGIDSVIGASAKILNPKLKEFSHIGNHFRMGSAVTIIDCPHIGDNVKIDRFSRLLESTIADSVTIGVNSSIINSNLGSQVIIGKNSEFRESVIDSNSTFGDGVRVYNSTIGTTDKIDNDVLIKKSTLGSNVAVGVDSIIQKSIIGDNVVIGEDVQIKNVKIGAGAIIGDGAIVLVDVKPGEHVPAGKVFNERNRNYVRLPAVSNPNETWVQSLSSSTDNITVENAISEIVEKGRRNLFDPATLLFYR